jgi:hypothetical protein
MQKLLSMCDIFSSYILQYCDGQTAMQFACCSHLSREVVTWTYHSEQTLRWKIWQFLLCVPAAPSKSLRPMFESKNNKNSIGREINGRVCVSLLNSHPTVSEIRYSIYHNTNCEMLQNWTFLLAHPLPSLISTIECDSWQLATPRCITLFMYCRHSY